ncbi:Putative DNA-binding domain-containing protein [Micromonospora rhizosphaerae]|uniref:Putative DNA-binding domain-containing protein n=1 Tax=Micromonospora rhizosphaerae TaxID=568872 RepID=A0A1C6S9S1_9ACTN|nr:ATP-binding protein [Micromonospora rhizosphaerae]SCL26209.1 Putative DNA-binding domain-containing protein [Micromonospora rhizosphaerae]
MVLPIDTSAPLLRPSHLTDLVRAVSLADPDDEHLWIEWKSTLDLNTSAGLEQVVKAIIGLANREPAAAGRRAGGYGYLLVGVEPGSINGVATMDPEKLVGKVRSYVGTAISWTPEYIAVDGKQVLVVIVDPPQPGDPIHILRKQTEKFKPATIFVRHTGRTDPANPDDFDKLQARLLQRTPSLQLFVAAIPSTVEEAADIQGTVSRWVDERRPGLLAARYHSGRREPGIDLVGARGGLLGQQVPDSRTEEQYAEEVEQFLHDAEEALVHRGAWDLLRHEPASLNVTVTNPTDVGFVGVRLEVHVSGQVKSYSEELVEALEDDRPNVPRAPKPFGTPTFRSPIQLSGFNFGSYIPSPVYPSPGPSYTVRDTGSVTIEYDDFELRAEETKTLELVPLLVHEKPGTTLTATWSATADGIRGRITGEFAITVAPSTLSLENLADEGDGDE